MSLRHLLVFVLCVALGFAFATWGWPWFDRLLVTYGICCAPPPQAGPVALADLRGVPLIGLGAGPVDEAAEAERRARANARLEEAASSSDLPTVGFAELASYDYALPDPFAEEPESGEHQIPDAVKALNGRDLVVEGYMVPIRLEGNRVRSFMLSRFVGGCCFGRMPRMNEWIEVEMAGEESTEYVNHSLLKVEGRLEVGEARDDYGYVTSIYRMTAKKVQ